MSGYSFTTPSGAISPRRQRVFNSRRPVWTVAGRRFVNYTAACNYADSLNTAGGKFYTVEPA